MQARLSTLASHRCIVEMLKPPSRRSFMGSWILGSELLLRELPCDYLPEAEQQVDPARCKVLCCTLQASAAQTHCLEARERSTWKDPCSAELPPCGKCAFCYQQPPHPTTGLNRQAYRHARTPCVQTHLRADHLPLYRLLKLLMFGMQLAEALGLSVAAGLLGVEELADCLDRTSITTGPHAHARDQRVWRVLQYFFQRTRRREHLFLPHAWPPGNAC